MVLGPPRRSSFGGEGPLRVPFLAESSSSCFQPPSSSAIAAKLYASDGVGAQVRRRRSTGGSSRPAWNNEVKVRLLS